MDGLDTTMEDEIMQLFQNSRHWSVEEDEILLRHSLVCGTKRWGELEASKKLPRRDNKACCNRFLLLKRRFLAERPSLLETGTPDNTTPVIVHSRQGPSALGTLTFAECNTLFVTGVSDSNPDATVGPSSSGSAAAASTKRTISSSEDDERAQSKRGSATGGMGNRVQAKSGAQPSQLAASALCSPGSSAVARLAPQGRSASAGQSKRQGKGGSAERTQPPAGSVGSLVSRLNKEPADVKSQVLGSLLLEQALMSSGGIKQARIPKASTPKATGKVPQGAAFFFPTAAPASLNPLATPWPSLAGVPAAAAFLGAPRPPEFALQHPGLLPQHTSAYMPGLASTLGDAGVSALHPLQARLPGLRVSPDGGLQHSARLHEHSAALLSPGALLAMQQAGHGLRRPDMGPLSSLSHLPLSARRGFAPQSLAHLPLEAGPTETYRRMQQELLARTGGPGMAHGIGLPASAGVAPLAPLSPARPLVPAGQGTADANFAFGAMESASFADPASLRPLFPMSSTEPTSGFGPARDGGQLQGSYGVPNCVGMLRPLTAAPVAPLPSFNHLPGGFSMSAAGALGHMRAAPTFSPLEMGLVPGHAGALMPRPVHPHALMGEVSGQMPGRYTARGVGNVGAAFRDGAWELEAGNGAGGMVGGEEVLPAEWFAEPGLLGHRGVGGRPGRTAMVGGEEAAFLDQLEAGLVRQLGQGNGQAEMISHGMNQNYGQICR